MRIAVFTRTGFHHTCFINRLQEEFEIACVVREFYPPRPGGDSSLPSLLRKIFAKRSLSKIRDENFLKGFHELYSAGFRYSPVLREYLKSPFDVVMEKPATKYLNVGCGEINSNDFELFLRNIKPDIVAALGSSIIKPNIISIPSVAMINLHSGLSPYYRGTWSYGWPVVNREPEYIGVTVHHVNPGIDTGDIIFQTKPVLEKKDDLNSVFLKVISEGIELVVKAIGEFVKNGYVESFRQPVNTGRQYFAKDFNADTARRCLRAVEDGIIEKYTANRAEIDWGVKLYGYVPPKIFK
ncbi:MAG: formyl transferase [Nitrospirota bacterium]